MATDNNRGTRPAQVLDPEDILRQWKILSRSLKSKSVDRRQVDKLVNIKENREIALEFRGENAATIINAIDKLLEGDQLQHETKRRAFKLMRGLAGASRQVPKSYLVGFFTWFTVGKTIIGSGGFADVRKGNLNGKDVAVKKIRLSLQDEAEGKIDAIHEAFCKECVVWMNMSHPNVHQLIAVKIKPDAREFSMISEMMNNGNIFVYTKKNKANRIHLLGDIARGLEYLHKSGVIHGDLKAHNVLINNKKSPRACIADFGLSAIATSMSSGPTHAGGVGTSGYMAPELFADGAQPSKEADMYAFGMVAYEVITGTRPFGDRRQVELHMLTIHGSRPPRPEDPVAAGFCQGTWEFAERCWDVKPGQRPVARQAVEHFERAARASKVVDPGPTVSVCEPVQTSLVNSSRSFCQYHDLHAVPRLTALQLDYLPHNRQVAQGCFARRLTPHAYWPVIGLSTLWHPSRQGGSPTHWVGCFLSYHPSLLLVWSSPRKLAIELNI